MAGTRRWNRDGKDHRSTTVVITKGNCLLLLLLSTEVWCQFCLHESSLWLKLVFRFSYFFRLHSQSYLLSHLAIWLLPSWVSLPLTLPICSIIILYYFCHHSYSEFQWLQNFNCWNKYNDSQRGLVISIINLHTDHDHCTWCSCLRPTFHVWHFYQYPDTRLKSRSTTLHCLPCVLLLPHCHCGDYSNIWSKFTDRHFDCLSSSVRYLGLYIIILIRVCCFFLFHNPPLMDRNINLSQGQEYKTS